MAHPYARPPPQFVESTYKSSNRSHYRCGRCGELKKGHNCAATNKKQPKESSVGKIPRAVLASRLADRIKRRSSVLPCVRATPVSNENGREVLCVVAAASHPNPQMTWLPGRDPSPMRNGMVGMPPRGMPPGYFMMSEQGMSQQSLAQQSLAQQSLAQQSLAQQSLTQQALQGLPMQMPPQQQQQQQQQTTQPGPPPGQQGSAQQMRYDPAEMADAYAAAVSTPRNGGGLVNMSQALPDMKLASEMMAAQAQWDRGYYYMPPPRNELPSLRTVTAAYPW